MQGVIMTAVEDAPVASAPAAAGVPTSEAEARGLAMQWANEQAARLTARAQNYLASSNGHANGGPSPRIGAPTYNPTSGAPYVSFDVVAVSPITFSGPPPYPPSKIIAAGDLSFLVAFIFTNPASYMSTVPASVALAARPWRMTLDQSNLTTGGNLPVLFATGVFPTPAAPMLTPVIFLLDTSPNSGPDPRLIEANITVYVDLPGQPYAAFATNFYDIDNDPGFPFLPPIPPETSGWRYDLPNRYLVYG
jgi:hypothetical protein